MARPNIGLREVTFMDSGRERVEIPVVYATDQNYLFYTCVSITSLAENASAGTYYKVYILAGGGFSDEEHLMEALNERYGNIHVKVIRVDDGTFDRVFIRNEHISKAAFYRLAICDSINEDKCIYLDSDTVVTEDLQELWHCDIEAYYLAGCRDVWIDWMTEEECERRRIETNIPSMKDYVNSGVLVFNLKKIREDRLNEAFTAHMKIQYPYEDQDILNVCCYGHILRLPVKWNNFTAGIGLDEELRAAGVKEDVFGVFKTQCGITHYITRDARPWEGRKAWKNWQWWQLAGMWGHTDAYRRVLRYVEAKERESCWKSILERIEAYQTVIIWGYTKYAMELCGYILIAQLDVRIYFCDSDMEKWGQSYKEIPVLSPEEAFEIGKNCLFLIASQRLGEPIREDILARGILEENILRYRRKGIDFYRMLDRRYYEQELDELFLKEAVKIPYGQRMRELYRHEDWIDRYFLKRWILKTE